MNASPQQDLPALVALTERLAAAAASLRFAAPTAHVYNPLDYAREPYLDYLRRYGLGPKKVIFLGMNPGPFGMAQTGIPFGEVAAVRDFLRVEGSVGRPDHEHPKRPVQGFLCPRSEVSGRRLWGAIARAFGDAESFFIDHFVANYCPLVFMEASGRNRTPDKLPAGERDALFAVCDQHLRELVDHMRPRWVIGVGRFAEKRAKEALADRDVNIATVLHPSPASPAANKGWAQAARSQLNELGLCTPPRQRSS